MEKHYNLFRGFCGYLGLCFFESVRLPVALKPGCGGKGLDKGEAKYREVLHMSRMLDERNFGLIQPD